MKARTRARWGRFTVHVVVVTLAPAACAGPSRRGSGAPAAEVETTMPATRTGGHNHEQELREVAGRVGRAEAVLDDLAARIAPHVADRRRGEAGG